MRLTQEGVERLKQSYFKLDENGAGVAVEDVEEISEPHRFYVGALNNQFVTIYQDRDDAHQWIKICKSEEELLDYVIANKIRFWGFYSDTEGRCPTWIFEEDINDDLEIEFYRSDIEEWGCGDFRIIRGISLDCIHAILSAQDQDFLKEMNEKELRLKVGQGETLVDVLARLVYQKMYDTSLTNLLDPDRVD